MTNRIPPEDGQPLGKLRPDDESGYTPPPDKPKHPDQCWSCGTLMANEAQGVSLTGDGSFQVCVRCWDDVPIAQRLVIVQKMRQGNEVAETLNALRSLLGMAIREYTHRPSGDQGARDN